MLTALGEIAEVAVLMGGVTFFGLLALYLILNFLLWLTS